MSREIGDFSIFGKKTPSQIHRHKNRSIWINIQEKKTMSEIKVEKLIAKREKTVKIYQI